MCLFDGMMFFNELDILEIRLHELNDVVDNWIIVEATRTHSGRPKQLFFAENRDRYKEFLDRIVHVVVDDLPSGQGAWAGENYQRRCIARGLQQDFGPGDTLMVSDADEIPSCEAVRRWSHEDGPRAFEQILSCYWANCIGGPWLGTRIMSYEHYRSSQDLQAFRDCQLPALINGGWHFSYMGGPDCIRAKLESFAHTELDTDSFKDKAYIQRTTTLGHDLFGRDHPRFQFTCIDERFPTYLCEQRARFSHLIRQPVLHEQWCDEEQLHELCALYLSVKGIPGLVIELGSWEGRSTIHLANACYPEELLAVDTWRGSLNEDPQHPTVALARQRDVYHIFRQNIQITTRGNVRPFQMDHHDFLNGLKDAVKFVYIDGSHDYHSVATTINALLPHIARGGIISGDDIASANVARSDLGGGVERAVTQLLPGYRRKGNLWWWQAAPA